MMLERRRKTICIPCSLVDPVLENCEDPKPSTIKMTAELKEWGFDNVTDLTIPQIEETWEAHAFHRDLKHACSEVDFPLMPSSSLAGREKWTSIKTVNFEMGGSFINDLESKDVPSVLELLAAFVNCDPSKTRHTSWERERSMFKAIPSIFIDCASKCRRGSGY